MSRTLPRIPRRYFATEDEDEVDVDTDNSFVVRSSNCSESSIGDYLSDEEDHVFDAPPIGELTIDANRENVDPNNGTSKKKSPERQSSPMQTFPPRPQLKSITKSKTKRLRKKRMKLQVFSSSKKKELLKSKNVSLKRKKVLSSENESVPKKRAVEDPSSNGSSLGNTTENMTEEKSSSKAGSEENDLPCDENPSVMSVEETSATDVESLTLKKESDVFQINQQSDEATSTYDSSEKDSTSCLSQNNYESSTFQIKRNSGDSTGMSADDEADDVKKCYFLSDAFLMRYKDTPKDNSGNTSSPEENTVAEQISEIFSTKPPTIKKLKKVLHREKSKEDPDYPNKILSLRKMLKQVLPIEKKSKRSQKSLRKRTPMKSIREEKSTDHEPDENFGNRERRSEHKDENSPSCSSSQKEKSERVSENFFDKEKFIKKQRDNSHESDNMCVHRENKQKCSSSEKDDSQVNKCNRCRVLKNLHAKFSNVENPWKRRVLRWISSILPELKSEEPTESTSDLSATSDSVYYVDNIDNSMDLAAETCIGSEENEEMEHQSADIQTSDSQSTINLSSDNKSTSNESSENKSDDNEKQDLSIGVCRTSDIQPCPNQSPINPSAANLTSNFRSTATIPPYFRRVASQSRNVQLAANQSPNVRWAASLSPNFRRALTPSRNFRSAASLSPNFRSATSLTPAFRSAACLSPAFLSAASLSPNMRLSVNMSPDIRLPTNLSPNNRSPPLLSPDIQTAVTVSPYIQAIANLSPYIPTDSTISSNIQSTSNQLSKEQPDDSRSSDNESVENESSDSSQSSENDSPDSQSSQNKL